MNGPQVPSRLPWPPMILVATFAAALVAGRLMPVPVPDYVVRWVIGLACVAAGLGLDIAAIVTLRRHRANILPNRAATALITTGPFALSRHPIYLGNTALLAGAALILDSIWMAGAAVGAFGLVRALAALPEERHLLGLFGDDYAHYCSITPRWLRLGTLASAGSISRSSTSEGCNPKKS